MYGSYPELSRLVTDVVYIYSKDGLAFHLRLIFRSEAVFQIADTARPCLLCSRVLKYHLSPSHALRC
jgi:hypothetical protein